MPLSMQEVPMTVAMLKALLKRKEALTFEPHEGVMAEINAHDRESIREDIAAAERGVPVAYSRDMLPAAIIRMAEK